MHDGRAPPGGSCTPTMTCSRRQSMRDPVHENPKPSRVPRTSLALLAGRPVAAAVAVGAGLAADAVGDAPARGGLVAAGAPRRRRGREDVLRRRRA